MTITKFLHACLLVETTDRAALFDPGIMSVSALDVSAIDRLDDIIITHAHPDHYHLPLLQDLLARFPAVHITAPNDVVRDLAEHGIAASDEESDGIAFFTAPHENVAPLFPRPEQIGVHYLGTLSHPGDSHSFTETKQILALPVSGPWASTVTAINLALKLKPSVVLPIHDWHWSDQARETMYDGMARVFEEQDITFAHLETGKPQTFNT